MSQPRDVADADKAFQESVVALEEKQTIYDGKVIPFQTAKDALNSAADDVVDAVKRVQTTKDALATAVNDYTPPKAPSKA